MLRGAPLSSPPLLASPSLPLICPPDRVRKDGGGGVLQEMAGGYFWNFHGVGCLGFPSPSFLLLLIFVFDPTAGRCMIVTDGCRFRYVNHLLRYSMQRH